MLKIDDEFKNLIPPLQFNEKELLEANLLKDGCIDPIVTWDGFIIDGHNRYEICTKHGIEYKTHDIELSDRNEAINWIIDNQLGKRNLPQSAKDFLMGKKNKLEKNKDDFKGNQHTIKTSGSGQNVHHQLKTAEKIAEQYQVNERTVRRNEEYADNIDKIAESSGIKSIELVMNHKVTKDDAKKLSSLEPETQKEIVESVTTGKTKTFKEALKPISNPIIEPDLSEFEPDEVIYEKELPASECETCDNTYPDLECGHCIYNGTAPATCLYTPYIPTQSELFMCPCGCGYGFCDTNEEWYKPEQIKELEP